MTARARTLVLPDVHGNYELLVCLLEAASPTKDDRIIQLGDLMNCVFDSEEGDLLCLETAKNVGAEILVGNHEHPLLGGPRFSGYYEHPAVREAYSETTVLPSATVGPVLITHAGLTTQRTEARGTAEETNHLLRSLWAEEPRASVFSDISPHRGGRQLRGGVLWADLHEPKERRFSQLFGHTPHDGPTLALHEETEGQTWTCCIDVGGKYGREACGAWLYEDGRPPEFVRV